VDQSSVAVLLELALQAADLTDAQAEQAGRLDLRTFCLKVGAQDREGVALVLAHR